MTRFSLRNPVAVVILALLVAILGVVSAFGLQEDLMPNLSIPVLSISTSYPGASPSQVATDITAPLEKALNGATDVQSITSTSLANVSQIQLQLSMSANLNTVQQNVQQIVSQVQLPSTAGTPSIQSFSFSNTPVLALTVASGKLSQSALKGVVNNQIVPALQGAPGVATVSASGAEADNVVIHFDPTQLSHYNLSLAQVLQSLQADTGSTPLGSTTTNGKVQPVQLKATLTSLAAIRKLPVALPSNPSAALQQSLGQSLSQMGQAIGKVASGVGQVGQGLGVVQVENQVLAQMQQVQGQLFGAQLALAKELALPQTQQNPKTIAQLQAEIPALQQAQTKLSQTLTSLEHKLQQVTGSGGVSAGTTGAGAATRTGSSAAGGGSTASTATLSTIPLSDLASVALQPPSGHSINRTNGVPSILVSVTKSESANTVTVVKALDKQLAALEPQLPASVHVVPLFDASQMITSSVNDVLREALLGALFAVVVIMLFLRNARTTLVAIVSIPLSILTTMILLSRLGITLNIMTLGGLAVATGRVVDDSIVVIENIFRTWRQGYGFGKRLIEFAVAEVGNAILSSTLATIAVFLPLTLVGGIVGKIFYPFALTVVCSLVSSLFVALTVVPILAWLFVVRRPSKGVATDAAIAAGAAVAAGDVGELAGASASSGTGNASAPGSSDGWLRSDVEQVAREATMHPEQLRRWQKQYRGALNWALSHKLIVSLGTAVAMVASILILPLVGSTFIQNSLQQTASISIKMPVGTPISVTNNKAKQVEDALRQDKTDIQRVNTTVGGGGQYGGGSGLYNTNTASLTVALTQSADVNAFLAKARNQVAPLATNGATIQVKGQSTGGGTTAFDIVVKGGNPAAIANATTKITNRLQHFPGLANVASNLATTQAQISVTPNLAEAAKYGLTAQQVAGDVRNYLSQQNIGSVTISGQQYSLEVTMKQPSLSTLSDIRNLPVTAPTGQTLTLGDIATVSQVQTPTSVLHENGQTYSEITADYTTQNTNQVLKSALTAIHKLNLPKNVTAAQSSGALQQSQSFTQLIEAILVAVGIVYMVMLILFGDWSAPLAILFSMPVALIGAFFGSLIAGVPLSVSSLIGILMLMGIVVTNAIVLIQRVEQQRGRGMTVREALLEAGTTRLRPILMTAVATICALLPLALGAGQSVLISKGLAIVVIGGLFSSTILTLVIVPLAYELLHFRIHRRERRMTEAL
ncbi:efflux RND transporter permease subunit [Alicyclobacillus sp. ALC3]|uniref:efflux RND transporter permease subunit n=1 Tax=Alicyclobacillus sp. ALC3 TaxID=2796143 RepID=UPI002378C2EF|nr:efflux RND transporter permease subunit [Alicyclobacillus sp. ALC3]WDL95543.1 efflux RND transporter permease subunit [Alicyclobacillus sp. ALC3]